MGAGWTGAGVAPEDQKKNLELGKTHAEQLLYFLNWMKLKPKDFGN